MATAASDLRRTAAVVFGCLLVVLCACIVIDARSNEGSYLEALGITVHVESPSAGSYLQDVFPRYKSFDPTDQALRFMENQASKDLRNSPVRSSQDHETGSHRVRTQSKYVPAQYNPEAKKDMKEMINKWRMIVRELGSVETMLQCAAKCPPEDEDEDEESNAGAGQQDRAISRASGALSDGEQVAGAAEGSTGEGGSDMRIVSTACLLRCGVPPEMLNVSEAAHELGWVRARLKEGEEANTEGSEGAGGKARGEVAGARGSLGGAKMRERARLQELLEDSAGGAGLASAGDGEGRGGWRDAGPVGVRSILVDWTAAFARSLAPHADAVAAGVGGQEGVPFAVQSSDSRRHTPGRPGAISEVVTTHVPDVTDPKHPHEYQGFL